MVGNPATISSYRRYVYVYVSKFIFIYRADEFAVIRAGTISNRETTTTTKEKKKNDWKKITVGEMECVLKLIDAMILRCQCVSIQFSI